MGFYFRRTVRVGPLNFSLSKSGIGVSAGIPGFRVGTGPRGNYVHMGANGFYYRTTLPSVSSPRPVSPSAPRFVSSPGETHAPLESIGSTSVCRMVDSTGESLLEELRRKNARIAYWPFVLALSVIVVWMAAASGASPWLWGSLAVSGLGISLYVDLCDRLARTVVLFYDFDESSQAAYSALHDRLRELSRCGRLWHVDARGEVYDPKYHAGAGHLVRRNRTAVQFGDPPRFGRTSRCRGSRWDG